MQPTLPPIVHLGLGHSIFIGTVPAVVEGGRQISWQGARRVLAIFTMCGPEVHVGGRGSSGLPSSWDSYTGGGKLVHRLVLAVLK